MMLDLFFYFFLHLNENLCGSYTKHLELQNRHTQGETPLGQCHWAKRHWATTCDMPLGETPLGKCHWANRHWATTCDAPFQNNKFRSKLS